MAPQTLIGYAAAPLPADQLLPWVTSFRRVSDAEIVLLADPAGDYDSLTEYGVRVTQANLRTCPDDQYSVYRDRWLAVAKQPLRGMVLLTDTRDVYFQRDPFPQIGDRITVATEGAHFKVDSWNRDRMMQYFPDHATAMMAAPNICAGVVGGPAKLIRELAGAVWLRCHDKPGMADQAALNLALRIDYPYHAIPYTEAWCCHCARISSTSWYTEEMPKIGHGMVVSPTAGPFAIVHHWPMYGQLKHFGDLTWNCCSTTTR